jgi:hypothetical protein
VRLVIVGTIIIIVPLITLFLLRVLLLLVLVFDLTVCISAMDDVTQVTVVPTMPLAALLWWSDAIVRVPVGTMPVLRLVSLVSDLTVMDRIHHGCYVQHRLEALNMHIDFFIIFGQMGVI